MLTSLFPIEHNQWAKGIYVKNKERADHTILYTDTCNYLRNTICSHNE